MLRSLTVPLGYLLLSATLVLAQEPPVDSAQPVAEKESYESVWMQKKLEMSQGILESLARGDLGTVSRNARTMRTLSKIEGWARRRDTREYRRQLKFFEQAINEIINHSENDNLDGATLAFTQMTVSCVGCHQHLRDDLR